MNLDIQLFGGRGASSSNTKGETKVKVKVEESIYENRNVNDYGMWWEDNLYVLVDKFEEKYKQPPVNNYGTTNSKWDTFTRSEYNKELKKPKRRK